ncbi:hypothetical protein NTGZN8_110033 [Candidatus Nitrotoga fabula]|uniref:Uncharacterized protein n=1 Tax=Candidatus Nitrotoga fabula TaxID=2182327 RepID=A0A916FA68_9PROT|nr:hypothetical protein NTGZN8_110033 [Candidatus Nitrotoga fabula]
MGGQQVYLLPSPLQALGCKWQSSKKVIIPALVMVSISLLLHYLLCCTLVCRLTMFWIAQRTLSLVGFVPFGLVKKARLIIYFTPSVLG